MTSLAIATKPTKSGRAASASRRRAGRGGVTVLELVVVAPVMVIFLAAVIEFGLILANVKYLPMASRAGAKILAETPAANLDTLATLSAVANAVDQVLATGQMSSCRVIIEKNVGGYGSQQTGNCNCTAPVAPAIPTGGVRVTVCVPVTQLTPDLLGVFGFCITNRLAHATTAYPHEL
jgi:Flp pilus assembly protein TadG